MKDIEKLIEYYSYYYSDSKEFVKEYLDNFTEMDILLHKIFDLIKHDKQYNITLGETNIMIENKKTKESYKLTLEF